MNTNNIQRKLKKLKAVSLKPTNVFYDCLAQAAIKLDSAHNIVERHWSQSSNTELERRNFEPIDLAIFTLPGKSLFSAPDNVRELLEEFGICVLSDFVDNAIATHAGKEVSEFLTHEGFICDGKVPFVSDNSQNIAKETIGETENYSWQFDNAKYKFTGYREIQKLENPFINVRSRNPGFPDAGKIDVFNGQKLAKAYAFDNLIKCYQAIQHPDVISFIEDFSGYKVVQPNLYYDGGVTTPRGPHIDNNLEQYKIFVYLTDVLDARHGPYCYVPGSHKKRDWMSKERLINSANDLPSTEVASFAADGYTKMLAPAGTAIISTQSGIHGAWPQQEDGCRALILGNYN